MITLATPKISGGASIPRLRNPRPLKRAALPDYCTGGGTRCGATQGQ